MAKQFDRKQDGMLREAGDGSRAARPKDAATLVLVKKVNGKNAVLMGQRSRGHKFMPDRYVFPGGRVDRADGYAPSPVDLQDHVREHLQKSATPFRARAIALAAIRETFEETGLILGHSVKGVPAQGPASWQSFYEAGFVPALDRLEYMQRAITPPYRPIRFNARFFIADGNELQGDVKSNGELLHLDWIPVRDAMHLPLPNITLRVLGGLEEIIEGWNDFRRRDRTPLYHHIKGQPRQDLE